MELGLDTKGMGWLELVWELDFDVNPKTLQRTMRDTMTYRGHPACTKEDLPQRTKDDRWAWADTMLIERRDPGDWKNIRWSDEFHAGFGPEGQLWIIRKRGSGMRGRFNNIQHKKKPTDTQAIGKVHAWAAVGWEFKTPLIFYTVDDPQGTITNKAYIEQILEVEVKKWGTSKEIGYVLDQDGASGHGALKPNIGTPSLNDSGITGWKHSLTAIIGLI